MQKYTMKHKKYTDLKERYEKVKIELQSAKKAIYYNTEK